ncbi:late cornified envelope 6A [Phyllostomus discolor]|uniref:Late cornified envelope 6A n=1 Tax=Phyllostomus discolor TaxID=89673 RepID=A0A833YKH3_9CHIR|nr:late cornified envelope 6A [Phyllostomus discolor]
MSQQKQQPLESSQASKCPRLQDPHPSLTSCSAPCCTPHSGGCGSGSQSSRTQSQSSTRRASQQPRCLRGGTVYNIKEKEC